jgi:pimeloyl-ACP methyl ester carboxylesterase
MIIVAGYCQSVVGLATWLHHKALARVPNTVIAIERQGIGTNARLTNLGRHGMKRQLADMVAIIEALKAETILLPEQEIIWIGHSLGAHLSVELTMLYPTSRILLLSPIPVVPLALLLNPLIWIAGGVALPMVVWSILTGYGGACPRWTKWLLFSGWRSTAEEFKKYCTTLHLDAGAIFLQVLLGYGWLYGKGLWRLRKLAKQGRIVTVGCIQDWIMPVWGTWLTAKLLSCPVLWLKRAHCFWVHDPDESAGYTVQEALQQLLR